MPESCFLLGRNELLWRVRELVLAQLEKLLGADQRDHTALKVERGHTRADKDTGWSQAADHDDLQ